MNSEKKIILEILITNLAKKDKMEYINYIRKFQTDENNLKKFIFGMLNGIHVKKDILDFMTKTKINNLKKSSVFIIYLYGNIKRGKVFITKEKNKIGIMLNQYENFKFSFPEESGDKVYAYIGCNKGKQYKTEVKILGLVYHWKNIFQGIKTPCINVFLGPNYKSI